MIWSIGQRRGRVDVVFALLILIVFIGILQDRLFVDLDKKFFPHKFDAKTKKTSNIWTAVKSYSVEVLVLIGLVGYSFLLFKHLTMSGGVDSILTYLFEDTLWVIHVIFFLVVSYKAKGLYNRFITKPKAVKTA